MYVKDGKIDYNPDIKRLKETHNLSKIQPLNFDFLADFLEYLKKLSECLFQTEYFQKAKNVCG